MFTITDESFIQLENPEIGVVFSGVEVDVLGYANDIPFVIYVTYKGRGIPVKLEHPEKDRSAVVKFDLDKLVLKFKKEKEGRYIEILKTYLEESLDGKSWVHHPRAKKVRGQADPSGYHNSIHLTSIRKKSFSPPRAVFRRILSQKNVNQYLSQKKQPKITTALSAMRNGSAHLVIARNAIHTCIQGSNDEIQMKNFCHVQDE